MRALVNGADGRVASDRPDDEVSGGRVGEVRAELVFKLSEVPAAEDAGEDTPEDIWEDNREDVAWDIEEDEEGDKTEDCEEDVEPDVAWDREEDSRKDVAEDAQEDIQEDAGKDLQLDIQGDVEKDVPEDTQLDLQERLRGRPPWRSKCRFRVILAGRGQEKGTIGQREKTERELWQMS